MKRISILTLSLVFFASLAFGQGSKVTTGLLNHDQGEYEEAVANLEAGTADPSLIKPKKLMKAYVYLAQSYMQLGNNPDPEMRAKYPDALLKAYESVDKAKGINDPKIQKSYADKINTIETLLGNSLYNGGALAYNDKAYSSAKDHFEKALVLSAEDYRPALMLGYSDWMLSDTVGAIAAWESSIQNYKTENPAEPDPNIASAYLLLGTSYLAYEKDVRKALEVIGEGRQTFPLNEDLQLTELGIYQANPELFKEARGKFEQALEDQPEDKSIKLAFAALLAQNGEEEKGLELYNEVLAMDPNDFQANLNVGAHYINEAAVVSQKMMEDGTSEDDIAQLEKDIIEKLNSAYPYMLKCHEAQPENIEWVNQLANITLYVPDLLGESKKWIDLQKQLKGE